MLLKSTERCFIPWECHCRRRNKAMYRSTWTWAQWYKPSLTTGRAICFKEKCKTFLNEALGILLASSSLSARACACSPAQNFLPYIKPQGTVVPVHICHRFKPRWDFAGRKCKQKLPAHFCCLAGQKEARPNTNVRQHASFLLALLKDLK